MSKNDWLKAIVSTFSTIFSLASTPLQNIDVLGSGLNGTSHSLPQPTQTALCIFLGLLNSLRLYDILCAPFSKNKN
jgi:hypothetical protein